MKSNFVTRTISVAVFLLVTFYFGARVLSYFLDPLTTTAAYRYRGEEGATVSGYLIREETVLDNVDSDMVYQPREEGEKSSKGGRVAVIYHNAQALEACPWARGRDVYLDGFTDFTAQERLVLEQLFRQAASVTVPSIS